MQIEKIEPRVITYRLVTDKRDGEYAFCMWSKYIFDCDSGRLTVNSDAGDYTYMWGYNFNEEFMHLMSRVDEEYLLNKLSYRSVFKIEESKAGTISNIKKHGQYYIDIDSHEQMGSIVEKISDIVNDASEEEFIREVYDILPGADWEDIEVEKDYPYGARIVVRMFIKYLQPKIKEDLTVI